MGKLNKMHYLFVCICNKQVGVGLESRNTDIVAPVLVQIKSIMINFSHNNKTMEERNYFKFN